MMVETDERRETRRGLIKMNVTYTINNASVSFYFAGEAIGFINFTDFAQMTLERLQRMAVTFFRIKCSISDLKNAVAIARDEMIDAGVVR
jgi:hypothetical protein